LFEVLSKELRTPVDPQRAPLFIDKNGVLVARLAYLFPHLQRRPHAGGEHPSPGLVGLVLVESNRAPFQVKITPEQGSRFVRSHPFPRQEPVQEAEAQRHHRRPHQLRILVRVEVRHGFAGPQAGQEATRERVGGDEAGREDREPQQPVKKLGYVAARRWR
jgi:hypothetical protein